MLGTILGTQGNMDRRSPEQQGSGRLNVFFVTFQQGGSQRGVFWKTSCVRIPVGCIMCTSIRLVHCPVLTAARLRLPILEP